MGELVTLQILSSLYAYFKTDFWSKDASFWLEGDRGVRCSVD